MTKLFCRGVALEDGLYSVAMIDEGVVVHCTGLLWTDTES